MALRDSKYRQAAVTYFVYGLLYLSGALYAAATGTAGRGLTSGGAMGWFALGGLIVVVFPLFIWKEFKWFTRILAILLAVRIIGLVYAMVGGGEHTIAMPGGAELPLAYGTLVFLLITLVTCAMLIRAGWNVNVVRGRKADGPADDSE